VHWFRKKKSCELFLIFATSIEYDGVLFSTWKLSISAKHKHIIGLASGKIKISGDKTVSRCHLALAAFFQPLKEVTLRALCHSFMLSVCASFARHPLASGLLLSVQ